MATDVEQKTSEALKEDPKKKRLWRNVIDAVKLAWAASPKSFLAIAAFTIVAAVIPPIVVELGRRLVDLVASSREVSIDRSVLLWTVAGLGAAAAGQRVLNNLQSNRQTVFAERVGLHAQARYLEVVSHADAGYFDDPKWHDRVQRASRDVNFRPSNLTRSLISLVGSAVTVLGMFAVLLRVHYLLVGMALIAVLIPIPVQRGLVKKRYSFYFEQTPTEREMYYLRWVLTDSRMAKDLRAFLLEDCVLARHRKTALDRHERLSSLYRRANQMSVVVGLFSGAALALAYWFVASRGVAGEVTPGQVTAVMGALTSVTSQVSSIIASLIAIEEHATFLDDYFTFLELPRLIEAGDPKQSLPKELDDGIRFEGVHFSYPGVDQPALGGIDLHIKKGELVALVGENGAGKTSMVKLLLRFYDPTSGRITIGGVDLRNATPQDIRDRIGVLFQDAYGYVLSARENVTLGRVEKSASDEEIWDVLRRARADGIVKELKQGLDSNVGRFFEGGKDLSGGEWQRMALARLMFRDADIWILDEPTSSLDPEAEAGIFAELKENLRGRMGIVISHRFSTVRIADRIAVVEDGRITELGTHEELMKLGKRYAHLFELQAEAYR